MLATAVRLFQRDGYAATSWRGLVEEAGTPWGSAHHHFPGGKEQLGAEAVALGSSLVQDHLRTVLAAGDPARAVRQWFDETAKNLIDSQYTSGCPIAAVALETAANSPTVATVCADAFRDWCALLAQGLTEAGTDPARAEELAALIVGTFEGAVLLAKTWRDPAPVRRAGAAMAALIAAELD